MPKKPLPHLPFSRFDSDPPTPQARPAPPVEVRPAERRHFRRGPFYLKIEGLDGPRPKYDAFGRLVVEAKD